MGVLLPELLDDGLSAPRPLAFAYMACPTYYPHAEGQWRVLLEGKAREEGFTIARWHIDHEGRTAGLESMLAALPGSGIRAIFVPDIGQLIRYSAFSEHDRQAASLSLNRQIFVVSDGPSEILPPGSEVHTPPYRPRHARRGARLLRWFRSA